jgi:hypothetical protein
MEIITNLYKVTCVSGSSGCGRVLDVYALADDESEASKKATNAVRDAGYGHTDYVKRVELVASSDRHKAEAWLIGAGAAAQEQG